MAVRTWKEHCAAWDRARASLDSTADDTVAAVELACFGIDTIVEEVVCGSAATAVGGNSGKDGDIAAAKAEAEAEAEADTKHHGVGAQCIEGLQVGHEEA